MSKNPKQGNIQAEAAWKPSTEFSCVIVRGTVYMTWQLSGSPGPTRARQRARYGRERLCPLLARGLGSAFPASRRLTIIVVQHSKAMGGTRSPRC